MAQESTTAVVRDVEDRATLAEMEARARVLRVEAESAAALASAPGEEEGFTQRIALLEGELAEPRQARDMTKENSRGMSDVAVNTEQRCEESERECQERV
jgi:hypothetical protein